MTGGHRRTDISLLGPLEVRVDGRVVPIARPKQRSLLAVLALSPGICVPKERLIDELWGSAPPETAPHGLQVHISGLRKLLGAELIETCPGGYRLAVRTDAVDASRAAALVAEGRAEGDRQKLADAVALFRGPALAGTELEGHDAARLEDLRYEALEEQFDLELAAGAGPALVAPLERLVAESPLRERPRGQLMRALYRAGRQADALAVFQSTRRTFVEQLGIEPSPALREIERAILQQDAALAAPTPARAATTTSTRRVPRLVLAVAIAALAAVAGVAAAFFLPPGKPQAASADPSTASRSTLVVASVAGTTRHRAHRAVRPVVRRPAVVRIKSKTKAKPPPAAKRPAVVVIPVTTPKTTTAETTTARPPEPRPVTTARAPVETPPPTVATYPTRTATTPKGPMHIVDTFDADVVNANTWNVYFGGTGADAVQRGGKLVVSIAAGAKPGGDWNAVSAHYGSRCRFAGDIDMQVDYRLISWPLSSGAYLSLSAVYADGLVERFATENGTDVIGSWIKPRFRSLSAAGATGSLRLTRVAGLVTTYYLDGGVWQLLDSGPGAAPAVLQIGLGMNPGLSPASNVVVELDNFSATAAGPVGSC